MEDELVFKIQNSGRDKPFNYFGMVNIFTYRENCCKRSRACGIDRQIDSDLSIPSVLKKP